MRFELMHPKIPEPKSGALNHSAKLPTICENVVFDSEVGDVENN